MSTSLYTEHKEHVLTQRIRLVQLLLGHGGSLPEPTLNRVLYVTLVTTLHDEIPGDMCVKHFQRVNISDLGVIAIRKLYFT